MVHTYNISGMSCNACILKIKNELLKIGDITTADIQLENPQAVIHMQKHIPINILQNALHKAGNYTITPTDNAMSNNILPEQKKSWLSTYKPILIILLYISIITIINAGSVKGFNWMYGMQIFMSGFFLTFSFFKMLDLKGFAAAYSTYDIIAKKVKVWGFLYPFIELLLGIAYSANLYPLLVNIITFMVMTFSIIGVLQSVFHKRQIQCACLGTVFHLPMSTVTIIEDALMIVMSGIMLVVIIVNS